MKKLFSLSLMIAGLVGSVSATPTHTKNCNTASIKASAQTEKSQSLSWAPLPEMGNPKKPCLKVAWAPLPEMGNPNKPC